MSSPENEGMDAQTLKAPKGANRSLWIMGLSIILVLYVHTSLSPALPIMAEDFGVDYSLVTWVLTAYLVSGAAVTIIIGRLADIYGAKKMLLVVFICYIVGIILAPFTDNFYTLIGLRILQGVAVALVPVSVRIARDLFPPAKFPYAQGMILSMYQGGSAVGLVLGAAVVFFAGWQGVFLTAIPFAILFFFLLWKFIPKDGEEKIVKDTKPRHFSKIIDIPGLITLILTVSTFMLSITFLGQGSDESIGLFWIFLAIGIVSIIAFFAIEKRSKIPLVDLKLAFHRIIRVGNVIYLLIGVVQYIIFSTIPTLGQTPEPYGLGLNVLQVGGLQLPQALVFVVLGPIAGILAVKYGNLKFIVPGSVIFTAGILVLMIYHSSYAEVSSSLVLFALGGAFVTLSANVIIYFTPRESTAVVSATYSTMRIIGGAIGPVIAGVFLSLYTSEVTTTTDVGTTTTTTVPNDTAFTIIFLVGAVCSLLLIAFMMIIRRRAISMGMPTNK
ncbi:MAG TPA: MFS transporter [Nitrososphaeraceae archaeon]|nr:MFS transporter [Nitrososphaeraceae archaeon]